MADSVPSEIRELVQVLRDHGVQILRDLSSAVLMWLFAISVFIPLAGSLNWQTRLLVSLLFFTAITLLLGRTLPNLKKLVDAFAVVPARKYGPKKGFSYVDAVVLFRHLGYVIIVVMLYVLYSPFLTTLHPSINGIVFVAVALFLLYLALRICPIVGPRFIEWLVHE